MKISTQNKLSLIGVYLVLIIITGIWVQHEVSGSIDEMMENTSELIVNEVYSALSEPLSDFFQNKTSITGKEIEGIVLATTEKSDTIVLIDVLKPSGVIIVSNKNDHIGQVIDIPKQLFEHDNEPKLTRQLEPDDDSDTHVIWTVLTDKGNRLGYLRIGIKEKGLSEIFSKIYMTLMVCALIGFLALLTLDMMLHLQLERITNGLMSLLEAALRGEVEKIHEGNDEFSKVRQTASKLSEEIKKAKTKVNIARRELDTVVNHLKVGLIITDSQNAVDFINDRAKLLISPSREIDQYLKGLDLIMPELQAAIKYLINEQRLTHSVSIGIDQATKSKQINVELYRLDHHEWQGCAILLHDQDFINALNDDLQSATHLRALSILLLGAIHDIKAPINAMTLNLELLGDTIENQHESHPSDDSMVEQINYVNILKTELKRLNQLIGGLYEQTIGGDKAKTNGDLVTIMYELSLLLKPQAKSQRVNIDFTKPEQPVIFFGYPSQIKQALLNILLNALEILPNGGDIGITLQLCEDKVKLIICDSGPGIPGLLRDRIFDMHFTTKATGTGIGLYVSKQIIKRHGGSINVSSKLGEGACFEVTIPTAETENTVSPDKPANN